MSSFKDVLKSLRTASGLTQDDLSKKIKISRSTVGMYESGSREPDYETLELIADFFNVDIDYLLGRTNKTTFIPNSHSRISRGHPVIINVLGRVAAGVPIEAVTDIVDTEEITEDLARTGEFFGLQIKGDSMEPRICDGDVVIVRQQEDADSGDTVIAMVNGNDAVCKRLLKYKDGISLISLNTKYEPMVFSKDDIEQTPVRIIGKVVELRGKF